jgi:hypothetical protein
MEWVFGPSEHTTLLKQLKDTYATEQLDFIRILLESQTGVLDDATQQTFRKAITDSVENFLYYYPNLKDLQTKINVHKDTVVTHQKNMDDVWKTHLSQHQKMTEEWKSIVSEAQEVGVSADELMQSAGLESRHLTGYNQSLTKSIIDFFIELHISEREAIFAQLKSAIIAKLDATEAQKEKEIAQAKLVHLTGQIRKQLEKTPKGFTNSLLDSGIILDDERQKLEQFLAQKAEEYLSSHYSRSELHTMAIAASLHTKAQLDQVQQQNELKDITNKGLVHKHTSAIARQLQHANAPKTRVLPVKPLMIPHQLQNRIEKINEGKKRISSQIKTPLQYAQTPMVHLNIPSTGNLDVKIYDDEGQELDLTKPQIKQVLTQPVSKEKMLKQIIDNSKDNENKLNDNEDNLFKELSDTSQPMIIDTVASIDPNQLVPYRKVQNFNGEFCVWSDLKGNFRAEYNLTTQAWLYKQVNGQSLKGNGSVIHTSLDALPSDEVEAFFKWFEKAQEINSPPRNIFQSNFGSIRKGMRGLKYSS